MREPEIQTARIAEDLIRPDMRELLKKYMRHVSDCEGTDFVENYGLRDPQSSVTFTDEEIATLEAISAEVLQDYKAEAARNRPDQLPHQLPDMVRR